MLNTIHVRQEGGLERMHHNKQQARTHTTNSQHGTCWCVDFHSHHLTFRGSFESPSTRACPYGREVVPSSWLRTMTAFLPA